MGRAKISADDIQKAIAQCSADLGNEIGLEIRDVFPQATDILYAFLGAPRVLSLEQVYSRLAQVGVAEEQRPKLVEIYSGSRSSE